jgi:hypothetical protein
MRWLLRAFTGLTTRGRAFIAAGLALVVSALVVGSTPLLRVALFVVMLPLLAAVVAARSRVTITPERQLASHRIPVGGGTEVQVLIANTGRLPTGVLLGEEQVPSSLGRTQRFVLERMSAKWSHRIRYQVGAHLRGRYSIGPLTVRMTDPFGIVVPRVISIPPYALPGEQANTGDSTSRAMTSVGEQDLTVREYRTGDDLRRVHWRSTARRGQMMVRQEEQPWRARATVLLDTRESAHRGVGAASSLEWAVSVTASVGVHLAGRGYQVNVVDEYGQLISSVAGVRRGIVAEQAAPGAIAGGAEISLLDALALVRPSRRRGLGDRELLGDSDTLGLMVAVTGELDHTDTDALVRMSRQTTAAMAIVADTRAWSSAPTSQPSELHPLTASTCRRLQLDGFRAVAASPTMPLPQLWQDLVLAGRSGRQAIPA